MDFPVAARRAVAFFQRVPSVPHPSLRLVRPLLLSAALVWPLRPLAGAEPDAAPAAPDAPTATAPAKPVEVSGLELGTLTVGKRTFHEVRARSRDTRSLFFTHREGLGSVRLRELAPEVQARLGYDPATAPPDQPPPAPPAAVARKTPPPPQPTPPPPPPPAPTPPPRKKKKPQPRKTPARPNPTRPSPSPVATTSRLDQLFLAYAEEPEIRANQSLQADYIRLNLSVKNQGRRPSCSIYAIVGALEFQNAQLNGTLEKLSEEYLLWATRHSLGRTVESSHLPRDANGEPLRDLGYTLPSVITALQTYGIPTQDEMPSQLGVASESIERPPPELIGRARSRRLVFIAALPGATAEARTFALVHALNAGFPVPAGLRWPHENSIQAGILGAQRPLSGVGHAVTFVGYHCETGRAEDAWFVFKNSYGPRWGQGGYGRASWRYLSQNLIDAYVLDVRAPAKPAP